MRLVAFLMPLLALPLWSYRAEACSCAEGGDVIATSPSPDSTGVPLNVELRVLREVPQGALSLRSASALVPTTMTETTGAGLTYVRIRPTQPLLANTRYSLVLGTETISAFTTGSAVDSVAPDVPVIVSDSFSSTGGGGSSCGPSDVRTITVAAATDDQTPQNDVWRELFLADSEEALDLSVPTSAFTRSPMNLGRGPCSSNMDPVLARRAYVALRSVDWAGNTSAATPVSPPRGCGCSAVSLGPAVAIALGALLLRRRS